MARMAASCTFTGAGKSGCPMQKLMMSLPVRARAFTSASTTNAFSVPRPCALRLISDMSALAHEHHGIDLDLRAAGKRRDTHGHPRRVGFAEVGGHDLVHLGEVGEVDEVDGHARHAREVPARGLGDRLQVIEHAPYLVLETLDDLHGFRIERYLAGEVDGIAGAHRLRIGADGGGSFGCGDRFHVGEIGSRPIAAGAAAGMTIRLAFASVCGCGPLRGCGAAAGTRSQGACGSSPGW